MEEVIKNKCFHYNRYFNIENSKKCLRNIINQISQ